MGDPVFDNYARTEVQGVSGGAHLEAAAIADVEQLIDLINKPIILLLHSGESATGWVIADQRSKVIKGIVAAEPVAPPIVNEERGQTGPGRLWGLSNLPIHYEPPVSDPAELHPVKQEKADSPDLHPCWVQQEPAHKLVNLQGIPVLEVSGEASYHRPYSHCVAKWLNQAGVKTEFVRLEDVGLPGNGHQFMSEKNSAGISKFFMDWLDKNVH
jgi:pimeloyl-ACP methyl ester carboxylesterase